MTFKGLLELTKKLTTMSNLYFLSFEFDSSSLINSYHRLQDIDDESLLKLGNEVSKLENLVFLQIHLIL